MKKVHCTPSTLSAWISHVKGESDLPGMKSISRPPGFLNPSSPRQKYRSLGYQLLAFEKAMSIDAVRVCKFDDNQFVVVWLHTGFEYRLREALGKETLKILELNTLICMDRGPQHERFLYKRCPAP